MKRARGKEVKRLLVFQTEVYEEAERLSKKLKWGTKPKVPMADMIRAAVFHLARRKTIDAQKIVNEYGQFIHGAGEA